MNANAQQALLKYLPRLSSNIQGQAWDLAADRFSIETLLYGLLMPSASPDTSGWSILLPRT